MVIPRIGDRVEIIISFAGRKFAKGQGERDIVTEKNIILYEEMIRKGFVKIIEFKERKESEKNENLNVLSNYRASGRQDAAVDAQPEASRAVRHNADEGKPESVRNRRSNEKRATELRKNAADSPEDGV